MLAPFSVPGHLSFHNKIGPDRLPIQFSPPPPFLLILEEDSRKPEDQEDKDSWNCEQEDQEDEDSWDGKPEEEGNEEALDPEVYKVYSIDQIFSALHSTLL